jgi:hypothetical protein
MNTEAHDKARRSWLSLSIIATITRLLSRELALVVQGIFRFFSKTVYVSACKVPSNFAIKTDPTQYVKFNFPYGLRKKARFYRNLALFLAQK